MQSKDKNRQLSFDLFKGIRDMGPFVTENNSNVLTSNFFKSKLIKAKISNSFFLRLIKIGKKKSSIFKVVVTNWNQRKVDVIGTVILGDNKYKKNYLILHNQKKIDLDFEKLMFWMKNKALPTPFVYHLLKAFSTNLNLFCRISRLNLKIKKQHYENE